MSRTNFKNQIVKIYNNHFMNSTSIHDPGAVAWSSKESQFKRFQVLCDIGVTQNDTILDLGCGLGHLVDYLEQMNFPIQNYTGIDINHNYVLYAIQRKPHAFFKTGEIFDVTDKYDYVVGSGVFTINMPLDEILGAIKHSYDICNKGVAFNFLNKYFFENQPDILNDLTTFVPDELYSLIQNEFNNVKLVTDYLDGEDFTIYIYK